ncbi:MAG: hypothetical protein QXW18_06860 [Candidatus Bathyarchaeia archaeon]
MRIKMPGDPTKNFPITAIIEVKRGEIMNSEIRKLEQYVYRDGAHLILIVTDKSLDKEILVELQLWPQIVAVVAEHRDLVKLLVIALAENKGVDIDRTLLSRTYSNLFDKLGFSNQIENWMERMAAKGYLITFEAFVSETVKACRFFINTAGKYCSLEECSDFSWNLRNLLPFGISSEIIPDIGVGDLSTHARILKDSGFLSEEQEKYHIRKHPSEERIIEILEHHGGKTSRDTLMKYFVFREAAEHIFDSLLSHMERKLLISREHRETTVLLKLSDVKQRREQAVTQFEQKKRMLRDTQCLQFAHILTWKEREWLIISLEKMEAEIERLLNDVALATDEQLVRSRTFLIEELVRWYGAYADIVQLAASKASEMVKQLELDLASLRQSCDEFFSNLRNVTRITELRLELHEIQMIQNQLNDVRQLLESSHSSEELEKMIKPLAGDKKARDPTRKERLITDIDNEIRSRRIGGDWTIPKYVLIKKKEQEIRDQISRVKNTLNSLRSLSEELTRLTQEMLKLF